MDVPIVSISMTMMTMTHSEKSHIQALQARVSGPWCGRDDLSSAPCHVTSCSVSWSERSATSIRCLCKVVACVVLTTSQQVDQSLPQPTFKSCLLSPGRQTIKIHMFFLKHLMSYHGALSNIIVRKNTTNESASTDCSPLMTNAFSSIAAACLDTKTCLGMVRQRLSDSPRTRHSAVTCNSSCYSWGSSSPRRTMVHSRRELARNDGC